MPYQMKRWNKAGGKVLLGKKEEEKLKLKCFKDWHGTNKEMVYRYLQ